MLMDRRLAQHGDLDGVLRKLIAQRETGAKRISQPAMLRFDAAVEFQNETFLRQRADREFGFHGTFPMIARKRASTTFV
jgi:hypothetical protein